MPSKTKKITKSKSKYLDSLDNSDSSHNSSETSDYELSDYEQRKVVRKSNTKIRKTNNKPLKRSGSKRSIAELKKFVKASSESESSDSESSEDEESQKSDSENSENSDSEEIEEEFSDEEKNESLELNDSDIDKKLSKKIVKNDKETDIKNIIFERINDKYYRGKYGDFDVIIDSNGYVNVTKLIALATGNKKFNDWTRLKQSEELIKALSSDTGISVAELLIPITTSSKNLTEIRGTYAHPELIPQIASWASPAFAIKVSKIVNNFFAKEMFDKHQNLIKKKNDRIDKLCKKIDAQTNKIDKQKKQIKELLEQGNEVLGYAKDTNRKINVVVNERVPMSDKPKNEESFYIVKNNDKVKPGKSKSKKKIYGYKAIRITNKSKSSTMSRYYKDHPKGKIILKIKYTPNAKHLWNACKDKIYIKDENITPGNNAFCYFNLCEGYSENKLKKDVMKIHNNRLNHNDV
ncbi:putative KilA-N domain-containing protein [Cotonvirus japonicus]|uniref:KilA-N domain-containing protein n=1 Tax=Cotonvirus japonicus TaxID=2811091 RepID=A0ABM7NR37_9VIRU|nr:putative KilA-N domain-containing protein [Cotonvirus japonicus]BCS82621.1 putative KilA-N domain-containing protein [Cotonvirus japonicus]